MPDLDADKVFTIAAAWTLGPAITPPSTKVKAADSVLNHAAKAIEIEDIEARVAALEAAAAKSEMKTIIHRLRRLEKADAPDKWEQINRAIPERIREDQLRRLRNDIRPYHPRSHATDGA